MLVELLRRYFGSVRLALAIIGLILSCVAFLLSYSVRPLTTQEASLIGG